MSYEFVKRIIDIIGSLFLLTIFSPIFLAVSLLIKFTSPGPVFVEADNQHMKRLGKGGKVFRIFKFRSMMVKADVLEKTHPEYKKAYIEKHKNGTYKPTNDPRVTPIGKFIRKHSLDELPQLLNVLKGDMSIIGPRPYLREELEEQTAKFPGTDKFVTETLTVKPGITGYWQTNGRSDVAFDKRIEMDAYYAKKRSFWFDFLIALKTPLVMLTGKGTR